MGFGLIFSSSSFSFLFSLPVDVHLLVNYFSVGRVWKGGARGAGANSVVSFLPNKIFFFFFLCGWLGEGKHIGGYILDTWLILVGKYVDTSMCSVFHRFGPKFGAINGCGEEA